MAMMAARVAAPPPWINRRNNVSTCACRIYLDMDGFDGRMLSGVNGMVREIGRVAVFLIGIGSANTALAQTPKPAPDPPKEPTTLRERLQTPDQGGAIMLTRPWAWRWAA